MSKVLQNKIFITFCLFYASFCLHITNADEVHVDNAKTLVVATSADFPPFEFIDHNKIVGIEPDILKEISKITGLKFEVIDVPFNSIIAGLTTGKYDFGCSGFGITEERKKNVDFTIPYIDVDFTIVARQDDFPGDKKINLLNMMGKKIAVQTATTMQDFLMNYNSLVDESHKVEIIPIDNNNVILEMLITKKIDAFFTEEMQGKVYTRMHHNLFYTNVKNNSGGYAMAFPKNSPYLQTINEALIKLKNNGTINKIKDKWETKHISSLLTKTKKEQYKKDLFGIAKSALLTIHYSLISIIIGLTLATILSICIYSNFKPLFLFAKAYISIIRGTPLLLQLSLVYFSLPILLKTNISVFTSGIIALSMNSAAYVAEIIRSGVKAIDKGQFDACKSLNLSNFQAIKDVYMPQILHNIFPALINEFIALIKESSMVSIIGGYEIMKTTNVVISQYYSYFTPLIVAGLTYYAMTLTLEIFAHWWEKTHAY